MHSGYEDPSPRRNNLQFARCQSVRTRKLPLPATFPAFLRRTIRILNHIPQLFTARLVRRATVALLLASTNVCRLQKHSLVSIIAISRAASDRMYDRDTYGLMSTWVDIIQIPILDTVAELVDCRASKGLGKDAVLGDC